MSNYSDLLKHPNWQKKRLEIMSRDDFKCIECGEKDLPLHVHHHYYIYGKNPWEYDNSCLITLCEFCHEIEENSKNKIKDRLNEIKINYGLQEYRDLMLTVLGLIEFHRFNPNQIIEMSEEYFKKRPKKKGLYDVYLEHIAEIDASGVLK